MKVLTSPDGITLLTFPLGGSEYQGLDTATYPKGIVAERPERAVKMAVEAAVQSGLGEPTGDGLGRSIKQLDGDTHPFAFSETAELMRDMRWIAKRLIEVEDGTEIGLHVGARGYGLDMPAVAKVDRSAGVKVGDTIAVGMNISPKAMMNARGTIASVNGTKVSVNLTEGDLRRLRASTGKNFVNPVRLPKVCVEIEQVA